MTQTPLRKARIDVVPMTLSARGSGTLAPGEWFVEQDTQVVRVYRDAQAADHVADIAVVDFLDGLARRDIVFVSWG